LPESKLIPERNPPEEEHVNIKKMETMNIPQWRIEL
jgi:hypothetical protein